MALIFEGVVPTVPDEFPGLDASAEVLKLVTTFMKALTQQPRRRSILSRALSLSRSLGIPHLGGDEGERGRPRFSRPVAQLNYCRRHCRLRRERARAEVSRRL